MPHRAALLALLILATPAAAERRYYEVRVDGQLAGHAVQLPLRREGEDHVQASQTVMILRDGARRQRVEVAETVRLRRRRVVAYESRRTDGGRRVTWRFEGARVERVTSAPPASGRGPRSTIRIGRRLDPALPRLCGLGQAYRWLRGITAPTRVRLFDPAAASGGEVAVDVRPLGTRREVWEGRVLHLSRFELTRFDGSETVDLETDSGWPFRVTRPGPPATVIRRTDPGVVLRVEGLQATPTVLWRRLPSVPPGRTLRLTFTVRGRVVARGALTLRPAGEGLRLEARRAGLGAGAERTELAVDFGPRLAPRRLRLGRTGGTRRALDVRCQFEAARVTQTSGGDVARLIGRTPCAGPVFPLVRDGVALHVLLAGQLPTSGVSWYRVYDPDRLRVVRVRAAPVSAGRFGLRWPDGAAETLVVDDRMRLRRLVRGDLTIEVAWAD